MKFIKIIILIIILSVVQQVYALGNIDSTPLTTEAQKQENFEHTTGRAVDIIPTRNGKETMTPDVIVETVVGIFKTVGDEIEYIGIEVPEAKWKTIKLKLAAQGVDLHRVKWSKDLDGTQIKTDGSGGENIHLLRKPN